MKTWLRNDRIATILLVLLLLSGCDWNRNATPFVFSFRQNWNNVAKIEICTYEESTVYKKAGNITPLVQLTEAETDVFKNEIEKLECLDQVMLDPPTDCGDLLFVITYLDGEKELLGFGVFAHISPDGTFQRDYRYCADNISLCKLFMQFADREELSGNSDSFKHWYNKLEAST